MPKTQSRPWTAGQFAGAGPALSFPTASAQETGVAQGAGALVATGHSIQSTDAMIAASAVTTLETAPGSGAEREGAGLCPDRAQDHVLAQGNVLSAATRARRLVADLAAEAGMGVQSL